MIFGIGIDVIEVKRVAEKLDKPLFKERIFSASEIEYCEKYHNKMERYAGRFAAKEAFLKAIGEGWQASFSFSDIEIINDEKGKPKINPLNGVAELVINKNINKMHVSIAHVKEMATSIVILET